MDWDFMTIWIFWKMSVTGLPVVNFKGWSSMILYKEINVQEWNWIWEITHPSVFLKHFRSKFCKIQVSRIWPKSEKRFEFYRFFDFSQNWRYRINLTGFFYWVKLCTQIKIMQTFRPVKSEIETTSKVFLYEQAKIN